MKAPANAVRKNGVPIGVLRPKDARRHTELALLALASQDARALEALEALDEEATFVGWLLVDGNKARLLDDAGKVIGEAQPGDHFVGLEEHE